MFLDITPEYIRLGERIDKNDAFTEVTNSDSERFSTNNALVENIQLNDLVFVLLPESEVLQREAYHALLSQLPQLQHAHAIRVFPYGRAAAQLALRQARKWLSQGYANAISVLAYHHPSHYDYPLEMHEERSRENECLIVATLCLAPSGLALHWADYELHTTDKPLDVATRVLLERYWQQQAKQLEQMYFPFSLPEALKDTWANSIQALKTTIKLQTRWSLSDVYSGDVGTASGLYSLCQLNHDYRSGKNKNNSLLLDISARAYRSAMMLSYIAP